MDREKIKKIRKALRNAKLDPNTVHISSRKGRWAVRREGAKRASRILRVRELAIFYAIHMKDVCKIVIHMEDGSVEKRIIIEDGLK